MPNWRSSIAWARADGVPGTRSEAGESRAAIPVPRSPSIPTATAHAPSTSQGRVAVLGRRFTRIAPSRYTYVRMNLSGPKVAAAVPAEGEQGHRERLLEAAIVCLQEKGFARTTARDLVAASGTNLASIGYHFGSKEHLLNVAVAEAFQRWLKPLVALAAEPGPATPLERLRRSLARVIDTLEENRSLVAACLEAWAQMPRSEDLRAEMAASYDDFHRVIAATTRDAFAEIGSADVDADALAALIIALFDGLLVQWQLDPERAPSAERLTNAAQGALAALAAVQ